MNNPQGYHIYKKIVSRKTKLSARLARSGGIAISIKKISILIKRNYPQAAFI
ncbi:hypothetical protein [Niabella hibiscisoli]|uniref:hypothetical protein n=1 Tax=Niabella hibiscisoli TaxID=1825928 RepID=UPI00293EEFE2|nr:hypothetical protein [Niabella hibiscisoli]